MSWRASALGLLVALPICFIAFQVAMWVRNVPGWDEFDTVLEFLIALDSGASGGEIAQRLFAVQNEHRMLVSRLIFASAYWIWHEINFAALAIVGNLFLLAAFGVLLMQVRLTAPRLRLAAIFALVAFQLQQHESFFWAGSSIDHFFVVLAVIAALGALVSRARGSFAIGCACAFLATFSLAHGLLVWPVGAVLLGTERRWRELAVWACVAAGAVAIYLLGFHVNPGHHLPGLAALPTIFVFWLTLAGSSPALDNLAAAPWLGAMLVFVTLLVFRRGCREGERLAAAAIAWCLGALAMIAWGRALISVEWAPVTSRYVILSSVAWALLVWVLVERGLAARRGRNAWWLAAVFVVLGGFNLAANSAHLATGRVFAQRAERAAAAFHEHGTLAKAESPLYPDPARADALIRQAERRGIYRLPAPDTLGLTKPVSVALSSAREIGDAVYFIEEFVATPAEVRVRGWALRPDCTTRLGDVSVLFRSGRRLIAFEATSRLRPDVAGALERADAVYSGFDLRLPREQLPEGEFGVGVCFDLYGSPEYMMTANTVEPRPPASHPHVAVPAHKP